MQDRPTGPRRVIRVLPPPTQAVNITSRILHGAARWLSGREDRVLLLGRSESASMGTVPASDGLILVGPTDDVVRRLMTTGQVLVSALRDRTAIGVPSVTPDEAAIGHAAAEHLLDQHFERFAFIGPEAPWSRGRQDGFLRRLAREECPVVTTLGPRVGEGSRDWDEVRDERFIGRWLAQLRTPVGILAANDEMARAVIDAASMRRLRVPEDVAVVGVDNIDLHCQYTSVPQTSIDPDFEAVGERAAEAIDALLQDRDASVTLTLVPPRGLVARRSTDALAIEDADTALALRIIRERACEGITVDEVLREVPLSRRALERRFRRHIGNSPAQEIARVRLKEARRLLAETDLPVVDVAIRCGFHHRTYFARAFKQACGMTPRAFRKQASVQTFATASTPMAGGLAGEPVRSLGPQTRSRRGGRAGG